MQERKIIELEGGWSFMEVSSAQDTDSAISACWKGCGAHRSIVWVQKGITKLKNILEGEEKDQFTAEQYMMLYT